MSDDMSWAWGGNRDSSRTSRSRANNIGRGGRNNRANIDSTEVGEPYGSDRPDADRSTGAGRTFYSIGNVNAWNRYQDNLRALERHQNTFGERTIDRDGNIVFRYNNQQQLNTARNLRASVFDYQEDTTACNNRDPDACRRVGRYVNRRTGDPPEQYRGDAMGGGTYTPNETDDPIVEVPVSPTGDTGDMRPPETPAVEPPAPDARPEDRTGRQEPEKDHSHRVVDPTASSGGSHSGKDGSKTQAGSDGVIHFDTGSNAIQTRPKNEVVLMLNNLRALSDPYNQDRRSCIKNKRLVE